MDTFLIGYAAVGIALVLLSLARLGKSDTREWKILAFASFFLLPVMFAVPVTVSSFEHMKTVDFCGSCHPMKDYVQSLTAPADTLMPSVHYRNNLVSQEKACYACHVSYAMFGGLEAKLNGLNHVKAFVSNEEFDDIQLYQPYSNDNCLHCHSKSERFRNGETHTTHQKLGSPAKFFERVTSGELSCMETGCHVGHFPPDMAEGAGE